MKIENKVLKIYEIVFLSVEIAYVSIFVLYEYFPKIVFLELTYGYGFYLLLSMFIAWAVILKLSDEKNFTMTEALIFLLLIIPVVDRVVLILGAISLLTFGLEALASIFLIFIFVAISLFFYNSVKRTKSERKIKLSKIDILVIIAAFILFASFFITAYIGY